MTGKSKRMVAVREEQLSRMKLMMFADVMKCVALVAAIICTFMDRAFLVVMGFIIYSVVMAIVSEVQIRKIERAEKELTELRKYAD